MNHSGRSDKSDGGMSTSSTSTTGSTSSEDSGVADVTSPRSLTSSMGKMSLSHSHSSTDLDNPSSSYPSPRRSSAGLSNLDYKQQDERDVMKYAHITNEYVRLSDVIDRMHPQQMKEFLKRNLHKKEQKKIIAMSLLFPRQTFPHSERLHCVRCHKEYDPHEKSNCIIRHPNACVVKSSQDKQGANFRCRACGNDFRLNHMNFYNETVNSHLSGFCYSGKHTANPREVKYHSAVRTCEETGCVEYYV